MEGMDGETEAQRSLRGGQSAPVCYSRCSPCMLSLTQPSHGPGMWVLLLSPAPIL